MRRNLWGTGITGIIFALVMSLCALPAGGLFRSEQVSVAEIQVNAPGMEAEAAALSAYQPLKDAGENPASDENPAGTTEAAGQPDQLVQPAEAMQPDQGEAFTTAGSPEAASMDEGTLAEPASPDAPANAMPLVDVPAADVPTAAAYTSPAPANFKVTYNVSTHTSTCTWSAVTNPVPRDYRVYKWDNNDYASISSIYQQLTVIDPAVAANFNRWKSTMDAMIANTPGYTNAERQAALDSIQADADVLNGVLCNNAAAAGLLTQFKALASKKNVTTTSWADGNNANNRYYFYAVVTRNNRRVETSPFSHTDYVFTVRNNTTAPAAPTGVIATAYDPGVFVEWNRNQEFDLAGYNVYLVTGTTWTKINTTLVTVGTEFYYASGTAGQVFGVTAVDIASPARESARTATATAVLAPATVYQASDPGWSATGTWKLEKYTLLPAPDTGPADLLVAQDAGATATHAFTGRRVRLYTARYWSCGSAQVLVDDVVQATVSLSGPDSALWGQSVFTVSGLSKGSHTFAIRCLGSGGSEGFNFVNVQYIEVR